MEGVPDARHRAQIGGPIPTRPGRRPFAMQDHRAAFARRLNEAFDALGIPEKQKGRYTALSKLFSVTPVAARDWCEGSSYPSLEKLVQIVQTVRRSADWLLFGRGGPEEELVRPEWLGPSPPAGHRPGELAFDRAWLVGVAGTSRVGLVSIDSDAMEPTFVRGEVVLVDLTSNGISDSGLYAFDFGSGDPPAVRRVLRRLDGSLDILCDNPAYRSQTVRVSSHDGHVRDVASDGAPVRVAGRVAVHLRTRPA
jgi:Peptidase S24-like